MKNRLNLGIIGLSEGNGHPYSWAAICNGYNLEDMKECAFPVIPEYLAKQDFPADFIQDAIVSHVWTQDLSVSRHIARSSKIPHVVDKIDDMLPEVDAVLLARDDAENHSLYALPVIDAGLPIYIDKPFALSCRDAEALLRRQKYHSQIYTCTALRYAKEWKDPALKVIGDPVAIDAITPKSWGKYSVHIIEPALQYLGFPEVSGFHCIRKEDVVRSTAIFRTGQQASFTAFGHNSSSIEWRVTGSRGTAIVRFQDSFFAFREALKVFIDSVRIRKMPIPREQTLAVVDLIERGT